MYNVWTDGSYREEGRGGAAWLIRNTGQEIQGSVQISTLSKDDLPHGSDLAEITAIACALRLVPDGARVQVHLDCANVKKWLEEKRVPRNKGGVSRIRESFDQAVGRIGFMREVCFVLVSDRNNENMRYVHDAARTASSLAPRK